MRPFANVTASLERKLRAMIIVEGPERANHREVVGAFADVLEPIADDEAALAVVLVAGLQRHNDLAIAVRRIPADDIRVDLLRRESGARQSQGHYAVAGRL